MDEVLKRKLFNTPKYEHKSTGIASGLEYRPGYKVGGRVGLDTGGPPHGHPHVEELPDYNPKLKLKPGGRGDFTIDPIETIPVEPKKKKPKRGETWEPEDYIIPDPITEGTIIEDDPFKDVVPGFIPELDPWAQGEDPSRPWPKEKNGEDIITPKDQVDFLFTADKDRKKTYAELDALRATTREEYDAELRALREKQSSSKNKMALLNMISAANDPNLRVGQSRVAAGAGALTTAAQEKVAWRDAQAEADLDRKGSREEADLALEYQRAERQIGRAEAMEDFYRQRQLEETFGNKTPLIKNLEWLQTQTGKKIPKALLEKIMLEAAGGNDVDTDLLNRAINKIGGAKEVRKVIYKDNPEKWTDDPLTDTEYTSFQLQLISEGEMETASIGVDEANKDGGRVGYQEGGGVETEEGVPMVMTYEQLRDKLPPFITDDIVKLIAYSPEAFKDFANIQTKQDVEEFNDKYDVDLVLPDPEQMDYAMPSTPAAETPATGSVSVPPAVAANPQMPMQTGTGALTPTETALLDPTEQAIRMRNR